MLDLLGQVPVVSLSGESISQLTSPTWFDWVSLAVVAVLAGVLGRVVYTTRRLRDRALLDISQLDLSVAGDSTYACGQLKRLGQIGLDLEFARAGKVGYLAQLRPDWIGDYRDYRAAVIAKQVVAPEWFEMHWDKYFVDGSAISTEILYLIQTALVAQTSRMPLKLTIVKDYYKLSFEWCQCLGFRDDERYMYPPTFEVLLERLRLLGISMRTLNRLSLLHIQLQRDSDSDHKYLIWSALLSYYGESRS